MSDIEKRLSEYRARKEREARFNKIKSSVTANIKTLFTSEKECQEQLLRPEISEDGGKSIDENLSEVDSLGEEESETLNCCTYMDIIYYTLIFVLWVTIYTIFIKLQFGTVYLVLSVLIGIYFNTRTGPKKIGEVSAYSVFNKDCKSIDGTLKAEQFEREIRYGGLR